MIPKYIVMLHRDNQKAHQQNKDTIGFITYAPDSVPNMEGIGSTLFFGKNPGPVKA
jgi:hypothetical protein